MKRLLMELGGKGALIMTEIAIYKQQLEESLASGIPQWPNLHSTHTRNLS